MPNGQSRRVDVAARERIELFSVNYRIAAEDRAATAAEQQLIADALIDYLLDEESLLTPARHRAAAALGALDSLAQHVGPAARPTIKLITQCITDLADRLQRREDANLIMREDNVMLSETVRQLKLVRAS